MSTEIKSIIVAGAGGNLGKPVLLELLKSNLKIHVLTRESSTSTFPDAVTVIKTDYSKESLVLALKGQDAVLSFLGTEGVGTVQGTLIDAAAETGVKRFIPSEFGHNTKDPDALSIIPLLKGKLSYVESLEKKGLSYTSIITGLFFDWGLPLGFLGPNLQTHKATVWDNGDVPFTVTNLSDIGKAIVSILTKPEAYAASKNQYVYLASHTVTQNELVAAAESATGKTFEVEYLNGQQIIKDSKEKLSKGDRQGVPGLIQAVAFSKFNGKALADYRQIGIWNERLGVPQISLEDNTKQILAGVGK